MSRWQPRRRSNSLPRRRARPQNETSDSCCACASAQIRTVSPLVGAGVECRRARYGCGHRSRCGTCSFRTARRYSRLHSAIDRVARRAGLEFSTRSRLVDVIAFQTPALHPSLHPESRCPTALNQTQAEQPHSLSAGGAATRQVRTPTPTFTRPSAAGSNSLVLNGSAPFMNGDAARTDVVAVLADIDPIVHQQRSPLRACPCHAGR